MFRSSSQTQSIIVYKHKQFNDNNNNNEAINYYNYSYKFDIKHVIAVSNLITHDADDATLCVGLHWNTCNIALSVTSSDISWKIVELEAFVLGPSIDN